MNRMVRTSIMIAMAFLLVSAPLVSYAAGPATSDQHTAGAVLTSDGGATWICTYQPERPVPEYFRGRAGQLERRGGRTDLLGKGRLVCKSPTGDEVKLFTNCQL